MSIMSIFSRKAPQIGEIRFDAVLEGATSKSVTVTEYPVEFGANVNDHAFNNPNRYVLSGLISNSPLGFDITDAALLGTGLLSSAVGGITGAVIGGVAAYALAGSDQTRAATAWAQLTALMNSKQKFSLQTPHEILEDMQIIRLDERTVPENEDGLAFIAELRQQITVRTQMVEAGVESQSQLRQGDRSYNQAAPNQQTGQQSVVEMSGQSAVEAQSKISEMR